METEIGSVATAKAATKEASPADLRHDWGRAEVEAIYRRALPEPVFRAQTVHRAHHAADRTQLSPEAVTLCFLAGANSIFLGEKLLTTPNPEPDEDELLLQSLLFGAVAAS